MAVPLGDDNEMTTTAIDAASANKTRRRLQKRINELEAQRDGLLVSLDTAETDRQSAIGVSSMCCCIGFAVVIACVAIVVVLHPEHHGRSLCGSIEFLHSKASCSNNQTSWNQTSCAHCIDLVTSTDARG